MKDSSNEPLIWTELAEPKRPLHVTL